MILLHTHTPHTSMYVHALHDGVSLHAVGHEGYCMM